MKRLKSGTVFIGNDNIKYVFFSAYKIKSYLQNIIILKSLRILKKAIIDS